MLLAPFGLVNNAAIYVSVQIAESLPLRLWDRDPEVEMPDRMVILCLIFFEEPPYCFLWPLHHFTLPPDVNKVPISLPILVTSCFRFLFCFNTRHPNGCEMVLLWFNSHHPHD